MCRSENSDIVRPRRTIVRIQAEEEKIDGRRAPHGAQKLDCKLLAEALAMLFIEHPVDPTPALANGRGREHARTKRSPCAQEETLSDLVVGLHRPKGGTQAEGQEARRFEQVLRCRDDSTLRCRGVSAAFQRHKKMAAAVTHLSSERRLGPMRKSATFLARTAYTYGTLAPGYGFRT